MKCFLTLLLIAPLLVFAQNKKLIIEGSSPDLYVTHTVAAKENYYSIGRLYNISPKEIAPFNNLQLEKGLSLNQVIKVPLTPNNFSQSSAESDDEMLIPLHHIVKDKESLYKIGTNYNKIPVEVIKVWNNIPGNSVSNGTKLIVGYLKVKRDVSPLAGAPVNNSVPISEKNIASTKKVEEKTVPVVKKEMPVKDKKFEVEKKEENKVTPAVVVEKKKEEIYDEPIPSAEPKKMIEKTAVKKETLKIVKTPGGYFKNVYDVQNKKNVENENGTAAVFKSTSGWEDGKYYCLHNEALPGTIVKITSTTTGKSIYAKVLDAMPDISRNTGILIRISNAAATDLGVDESKFDCTLSYPKKN